MKCPNKQCECIAPSHYKLCPMCNTILVKEEFSPQIDEVEEVEPVSALVVDGDIDDFGSM